MLINNIKYPKRAKALRAILILFSASCVIDLLGYILVGFLFGEWDIISRKSGLTDFRAVCGLVFIYIFWCSDCWLGLGSTGEGKANLGVEKSRERVRERVVVVVEKPVFIEKVVYKNKSQLSGYEQN